LNKIEIKLYKSIDKLKQRLDAIEEENSDEEETVCEIEARFAWLREARARSGMHLVIILIGCIWDEITQEELVTINKKRLRSPAGRTTISNPQERGGIFESRWYMRYDNGYDGYGCNSGGVCVPEGRS
jgi:hypothetical protein